MAWIGKPRAGSLRSWELSRSPAEARRITVSRGNNSSSGTESNLAGRWRSGEAEGFSGLRISAECRKKSRSDFFDNVLEFARSARPAADLYDHSRRDQSPALSIIGN